MKNFILACIILGFSIGCMGSPLDEGFETWPPYGWTIIQGPCSPDNDIIQTSEYSHSGTYSARFSSFDLCGSGYDEYLITPELDVTSGDQTISFYYRRISEGSETFRVGWSSTGNDISDFTWSSDITNANTNWRQYTKDDLPIGTKYVCIHYRSFYEFYLYIDDISGPELYVPPCPPPLSLIASNVTTTSADLGWTPQGTESIWNTELGLPGFSPGTGQEILRSYGASANPWTASPLTPSTAYHFYVQADCDFNTPKVDYFYMAMDTPGNLLPGLSGGTDDDMGETGEWYLYTEPDGDQWWNIWFYNDTLDTTRIKKIRMGFWIQSLDEINPGQLFYVINWSDSTWQGSGFPTPDDEDYIKRSPVNGPVEIGVAHQWIELYYIIPDLNPEWVSVDIWGENIQIMEVAPEPPPDGSPLLSYWAPGSPGGIIVHECMHDSTLSDWSGPLYFNTTCLPFDAFPYTQDFNSGIVPPLCWSETITNPNFNWQPSISGDYASVYYDPDLVPQDEWLITPVLDFTSLTQPRMSFDWLMSYYWGVDPYDNYDLNCLISTDGGVTWPTTLWTETDEGVFTSFVFYNTVIDLFPYAGMSNIRIAWQYIGADGAQASIDNVVVEQTPPCLPPTNLTTTDITETSAVLQWEGLPDSFFDISYFEPGSEPFEGQIASTITSTITIEELTPGTDYSWSVRTDCGFVTPDIDYFWMAMDAPGNLLTGLSGGTTDDPFETGEWYLYDQLPGGQPWWNIWFYNDTIDTTRVKKIRMGFWIQSLDGINPGQLFYVINWSDSTWQGTAFPLPSDEDFIVRSPVNGPVEVTPDLQWIEIVHVVKDFNPEWVSVDLWGENIIIPEAASPPPPTSPLYNYWLPGSPGGIIVHECLPDSNLSVWSDASTFTTVCVAYSIPWIEDFDEETPPDIPNCMTVTDDNGDGLFWSTTTSFPRSDPNCMYILWNETLAMDDWFFSPELTMDVGTYEVTFWYRNSGATYPEKLEVKWGSSPNAAGMTNGPIFSDDNIASENYLEATAEIVITTQGSYFIGWHGYSDPNMYFLLVDDISVRAHYVWTGSVSDAWDNSGNWDRGAVPGPEDIVIIPASPTGGIFPVIASGSSVEVFSLRCDASNISIQGDLIVKGKKIL